MNAKLQEVADYIDALEQVAREVVEVMKASDDIGISRRERFRLGVLAEMTLAKGAK